MCNYVNAWILIHNHSEKQTTRGECNAKAKCLMKSERLGFCFLCVCGAVWRSPTVCELCWLRGAVHKLRQARSNEMHILSNIKEFDYMLCIVFRSIDTQTQSFDNLIVFCVCGCCVFQLGLWRAQSQLSSTSHHGETLDRAEDNTAKYRERHARGLCTNKCITHLAARLMRTKYMLYASEVAGNLSSSNVPVLCFSCREIGERTPGHISFSLGTISRTQTIPTKCAARY